VRSWLEIDWIERYAGSGPGPRCAPERLPHRDVERGVM
jgi:hypothetical protein